MHRFSRAMLMAGVGLTQSAVCSADQNQLEDVDFFVGESAEYIESKYRFRCHGKEVELMHQANSNGTHEFKSVRVGTSVLREVSRRELNAKFAAGSWLVLPSVYCTARYIDIKAWIRVRLEKGVLEPNGEDFREAWVSKRFEFSEMHFRLEAVGLQPTR